MLITRIELENIKSYQKAVIDFRRGTTAISGSNGAGKTTIVEAIGYALFDHLPYKQSSFVREGEKYGRVVVHLMGGDDRPYVVERRCGSGSRWTVTDVEATFRIEQSADVQDKLHDICGIDRERALDALFRDALGVPQGTFTSIFLETASKRKPTFDALLQIEDYKTAADYLLDAQKLYKEQIQEQVQEIQRLSYETRDLEQWREALEQAHIRDQQQIAQNAAWTEQRIQHEARFQILKQQEEQLEELRRAFNDSQRAYEYNQSLLREREQALQAARLAQQVINESTADYHRYLQATELLKSLRLNEQQRNKLRQQHATLQKSAATTEANIKNVQARLAEVTAARQQLQELQPLVVQQSSLEKQNEALLKDVERYNSIVKDGKQLSERQIRAKEQQEALQKRIDQIVPLQPLADLFMERNETLNQLRIQERERSNLYKQFQERREQLREQQLERDRIAEKLRKAEKNIEIIEAHRAEAEEMPLLQERYNQTISQRSRLEGNIEGYRKWRTQSAGGQCPLLGETCLNIKQKGIVSLEFYFDGQLKEEHAQLVAVQQEQDAVNGRISAIKKYVDNLGKLDQYVMARDDSSEHLQRIAREMMRLERDVADIGQQLEALKQVEQLIAQAESGYNESKRADAQVRELSGLYKQLQQVQEQIAQYERDLQEKRQEAKTLQGSEAQLKQVKAELEQLRDPRARSQTQQNIIDQEPVFLQKLAKEEQQSQQIQQQLQVLNTQLANYETLDSDIGTQEAILQASHAGHQNYLKNENAARLLPEHEHAYQLQLVTTEQAQRTLEAAQQTYEQAAALFDKNELETVNEAIKNLRASLAALASEMQRHQEDIKKLEQLIAQAEALLQQLEAAQKEKATLEDLQTMMNQFRGLIKEAGPYVLKALLADISAEANRIFGEIMGDRSAQLSWQDDYEIQLRRQGVNRTFAQLSGGEQMSAALAVRLALLKKLSTLNIAFFDEPTQNMDELRRMNLAEQIRRVRGFEQLIVISHDDTFEQGLDSLIRLRKEGTATRIVDEEEIAQEQRERTYAS